MGRVNEERDRTDIGATVHEGCILAMGGCDGCDVTQNPCVMT